MVDIDQLLEQAKQMQDKMQAKEQEMANREFVGVSSDALVKVICTGRGDIRKIDIHPSIINLDNQLLIEDLIIEAFSNAKKQAEEIAVSSMDNIFNLISQRKD